MIRNVSRWAEIEKLPVLRDSWDFSGNVYPISCDWSWGWKAYMAHLRATETPTRCEGCPSKPFKSCMSLGEGCECTNCMWRDRPCSHGSKRYPSDEESFVEQQKRPDRSLFAKSRHSAKRAKQGVEVASHSKSAEGSDSKSVESSDSESVESSDSESESSTGSEGQSATESDGEDADDSDHDKDSDDVAVTEEPPAKKQKFAQI